jgi:tripartite-type tricarboxylate transporter receptor subunit TctC
MGAIIPTRRSILKLSASATVGLTAAALAGDAHTQAWPSRHVRLIVPYPAGGGADAIARIVGAKLAELWGQQVLIENRGGAGGNIASDAAAHSPPDGYTLYLAGEFLANNSFLYPKLSYDPIVDFAPVSLVVQYPTVIVVPNSSPARTLKEFIALAKASATPMTFATAGHGTGSHLVGELFKRTAGIELTHVPYRGAAPALQDLIPGRVDSFFNNIAPVIPLMQQAQLRALGVTTAKRVPAAPEVTTFAESGLPGFDVSGWYAFYFPARTPAEIVRKAHADTVAALDDPKIRRRLEELGLFVVGSTPAALAAFHKAEMERWGPIIKSAGITIRE